MIKMGKSQMKIPKSVYGWHFGIWRGSKEDAIRLIKQSKELNLKLALGKITPRSYETRDKTIRTKLNKILYP